MAAFVLSSFVISGVFQADVHYLRAQKIPNSLYGFQRFSFRSTKSVLGSAGNLKHMHFQRFRNHK